MKKRALFTILIILSLIVGYILLPVKRESKIVGNTGELIKVTKTLADIWRNADIDGDKVCKSATSASELFYQCNPSYLKCVLDKKLIKIKSEESNYLVSSVSDFKYQRIKSHKAYQTRVLVNDHEYTLSFLDNCHEVYLPERHYPFLTAKRSVTIEWDNFNKNIFVDKFQARVWEVREWANITNDKNAIEALSFKLPEQVATGLSLEQMQNYCKFHGKSILSAQVYDAISIYPEDLSNPRSPLVRAAYYPWSRLNSKTKIYKYRGKPDLEIPESERKEICSRVHGLDCGERNYTNYNRSNVSWMGAYELLGGYMEYVRNPIHPKENLVLSSMNYPLHSKVHTSGIRGYWDGEDLTLNNFSAEDYPIEKKINKLDIAFRCMRYRK